MAGQDTDQDLGDPCPHLVDGSLVDAAGEQYSAQERDQYQTELNVIERFQTLDTR